MKSIFLAMFSLLLISCSEYSDDVSYELVKQLEGTNVSCKFLANKKFSKGYWVREELSGNGLLVITKDNEPRTYTLALIAFGHERALEQREVMCPEL